MVSLAFSPFIWMENRLIVSSVIAELHKELQRLSIFIGPVGH